MATLLNTLDRALSLTVMRPWRVHRSVTGYYEVVSTSGIRVCSGADKPEADAIAAVMNATPALLCVARAAEALRKADREFDHWVTDEDGDFSDDEDLSEALSEALRSTERELDVALDALESEVQQ